jgi:hypothetical protein
MMAMMMRAKKVKFQFNNLPKFLVDGFPRSLPFRSSASAAQHYLWFFDKLCILAWPNTILATELAMYSARTLSRIFEYATAFAHTSTTTDRQFIYRRHWWSNNAIASDKLRDSCLARERWRQILAAAAVVARATAALMSQQRQ